MRACLPPAATHTPLPECLVMEHRAACWPCWPPRAVSSTGCSLLTWPVDPPHPPVVHVHHGCILPGGALPAEPKLADNSHTGRCGGILMLCGRLQAGGTT